MTGGMVKEIRGMASEILAEWSKDQVPRLSASLAYYTLLSLAPLLVVVVAVAALVYGQKAAQGQLVWEIQGLVGGAGAVAIQGLIRGAYYKHDAGIVATIFGILTLVFGASSVVVELRDALNTIWHAHSPPSSGFRGILRLMKDRFYAFALILGLGFVLLFSLILNAWIAAMGRFFNSILPMPEWVLETATFLLSYAVTTFLFAAIYKFLPDVRLRWSDVLVGASVTSLLFTAGKQLIAFYLGRVSFDSTYGAAGSLVLVLVWVYYSAQLFFLGAEFTKAYARRFGSHAAAAKRKKRDDLVA